MCSHWEHLLWKSGSKAWKQTAERRISMQQDLINGNYMAAVKSWLRWPWMLRWTLADSIKPL